ncbi:MAG: lysylphosphatidylglycerol synthase transmembrane domain-containing protein [bacterium]
MSDVNQTQSAPAPSTTRTAIARGVRVFVFIAVAAAVVVIAVTASRETWAGLGRIKPLWLAATFLLWAAAAFFDGARLAVLSRVGENRMPLWGSIEVIYIGYFMAAVTPFQVGGLPLQLYVMNRWGISPGKATSVLLIRGVLFYGILLTVAPVVGHLMGASTAFIKVLAGYIWAVVGMGVVLVVASAAFPKKVRELHERLSRAPKPGLLRRGVVWVLNEFDEFTAGLKLFLRPRYYGWLALALLLTVAAICALFGMSETLLAGLGVVSKPPHAMGLSMLLASVLLFVPTPGASGVAEAVAAGLYRAICPVYMLGVYVVLWRLFSFYAGAMVGGVFALRHISKK